MITLTNTITDTKSFPPEITVKESDFVLIAIEAIEKNKQGTEFAVICKNTEHENVQGFFEFVPYPEDNITDEKFNQFCDKIAKLLPLLDPNGNWTNSPYENEWAEIIRFDVSGETNFAVSYESEPYDEQNAAGIQRGVIWSTDYWAHEIAELIVNII